MTTGQFIAMLQKEDPSGTAFLRLPGGGVPFGAEHKPGYWDGAYSTMKDGKYHTSIVGSKVDIHVETPFDIIWELKGDMDLIRERFSFDYTGYSNESQKQDRIDNFWKWVEKEAVEVRKYEDESLLEWTGKLKKLVDQKDIDTFVFTKPIHWKGYSQGIEVHDSLCMGEIDAVTKGGLFKITSETETTRTYELI